MDRTERPRGFLQWEKDQGISFWNSLLSMGNNSEQAINNNNNNKSKEFVFVIQVSGCQALEKSLLIQEMGATNPEKVKMVVKNMETFMPKVMLTNTFVS